MPNASDRRPPPVPGRIRWHATLVVSAQYSIAFIAAPLVGNPSGNYLYAAGPAGMLTLKIDSITGTLTQVGSAVPYMGGTTVLTYVQ
jgi:hypothetical protein